jgi:biotin synthase
MKKGPLHTKGNAPSNWKVKRLGLATSKGIGQIKMKEQQISAAEMLRARGPAQAALHERAAQEAREQFGRRVFVRAVLEISNYCRENCRYCGMRRENRPLTRFRAQHDELAELATHHLPRSVTDVNIQAGEDPVAVREVALPLIRALRQHTDLGISVCLGTLDPGLYQALQEAGASFYIMKFEVANPSRYAELQAPGTLEERLDHICRLAASGWQVSSGFIAGLPGQTASDLAANLALARELPLAGCSVSPFIPGDETPLANAHGGDIDVTLNSMAALRLMRPRWIIPSVSALNLAQPGEGYTRGLRTGANLVTINLTPSDMRGNYLLYKRDRFIMTEERILNALAAEGLTPSEQSLADFLASEKLNGNSRDNSRAGATLQAQDLSDRRAVANAK